MSFGRSPPKSASVSIFTGGLRSVPPANNGWPFSFRQTRQWRMVNAMSRSTAREPRRSSERIADLFANNDADDDTGQRSRLHAEKRASSWLTAPARASAVASSSVR